MSIASRTDPFRSDQRVGTRSYSTSRRAQVNSSSKPLRDRDRGRTAKDVYTGRIEQKTIRIVKTSFESSFWTSKGLTRTVGDHSFSQRIQSNSTPKFNNISTGYLVVRSDVWLGTHLRLLHSNSISFASAMVGFRLAETAGGTRRRRMRGLA
jgi:hypothetical protein